MTTIKTRYSKQRELILNNLRNRNDHPSVEEVYQDLKKDHPNLSLGTVYRNLNYLAEAKMIRKLDIGEQIVHYDGNMAKHFHFICQKCHEVYDIYNNISDNVISELKNATQHQVDDMNIIVTGTCECCLKKEKGEHTS